MKRTMGRRGVTVCFLFAAFCAAADVFHSPGGRTVAEFTFSPEGPKAVVSYDGKQVAALSLGLTLDKPFVGGFEHPAIVSRAAASSWKPVWGDRSEIRDAYTETTVTLREKGPAARLFIIQMRASDEGFAVRYRVPFATNVLWTVRREETVVRFPPGAAAWAIPSTEAIYPVKAVLLSELKGRAMLPLTVENPGGGVVSLLEAYAVHYARAAVEACAPDGVRIALCASCSGSGDLVTPWRALVLAAHPAELIEHAVLVQNLNPPCAIRDTSWIRPGLTASNEGNCPILMDRLFEVADLVYTNNFKYIQIDWGWYGTEWTWTDAERATFRTCNPKWKDRKDWVINSYADPRRAAVGLVGYRPDWKSATTVELDLPKLIAHLRARGLGLCLYLHGRVLEANDMDRLFALYEEWGLAGLKPGFVRYGSAADTDWIRTLVETAARHRLWLCIHDAHIPDGLDRTYPNVMLCEGGGGQEQNPPPRQDVTHPFTRCLAGPFDYTPSFFAAGRTHTHMVAFPFIYGGPSAVIRGRSTAQFGAAGADAFGPELAFFRKLPMTYDASHVIDAEIGRRIVVARRSGSRWFLAGMTGAEAGATTVRFHFLPPGKRYALTLFRDGNGTGRANATVKETRTVVSTDAIEIPMAPAGGFVAFLEEK